MMLRSVLPLMPDESVVSWVRRIGLFHCGLEASEFLKLIGVPQLDLISGKRQAHERLVEVTGVPMNVLALGAFEKVSDRLFQFKKEQFYREFLDLGCMQFCPACMLSDIENAVSDLSLGFLRINWAFAPIRTCAIHNLPLVKKQAEKAWDIIRDYTNVAGDRSMLEQYLSASKPRSPSRLQLYVNARFESAEGNHWMDSQQIDLASRATEMLGACIEFGPNVSLSNLTEDDWDTAGRVGFEFTSRGKNGIYDGLDLIYRRPRKKPICFARRERLAGFMNGFGSRRTKSPSDPFEMCFATSFWIGSTYRPEQIYLVR
ncbi:TniQ family protein [Ruegeria sp. AU67]|uniref:TniQ family protein n=1 Tax=Ruegeria sp. AU67 TaxID=2108530 RepID=UPI000D68F540